jgi:biopolymer transport protein ExbD
MPIEDHMDMTAMVDVVFQLMAFLLLTFQAAVTSGIDLPDARHGRGVQDSESVILTIQSPAAPGAPARVFEGPDTEPRHALATPESIRAVVERGMEDGRKHVVLQAEGTVPHGEVLRLAALVGEVQGVVLHIGVDEPEPGR